MAFGRDWDAFQTLKIQNLTNCVLIHRGRELRDKIESANHNLAVVHAVGKQGEATFVHTDRQCNPLHQTGCTSESQVGSRWGYYRPLHFFLGLAATSGVEWSGVAI